MKLPAGFHRECAYGGNPTLKFWGFMGGGIAMVIVGIAGFFLTLWSRGSIVQLTFTTTLPMVVAVGLFATAIAIRRAPRSIVVNEAGVTVSSPSAIRQHPWDAIAWSDVNDAALGHQKHLNLYGADGKVLVRIPQGMQGFDELVGLFEARNQTAPSAHAVAVQWKHARRRALYFLLGGMLALLLGAANAWMAYENYESDQLLRTRGQPGTARIVRKFTAPDGVTRRIELSVTDASGESHIHNLELEPAYWTLVSENTELPVITVPGRPDIARLTFGEVVSNEPGPKLMGIVSAAVMLLGLVMLGGAFMSFRGVDIDFVSGKGLQVRRLGQPQAQKA